MFRKLPVLAATAALAFGAAACGEDEETATNASSDAQAQQQQQQPEPVAQVDSISNGTTAVTLDSGFVEALTSLELTPAPVGDAEISEEGVATFPITEGNVTYYEPGTVSPFVQGSLSHDGAGLSLTGGGKTVELTDFVVDPGASVLTGTVTVDGEEAATDAPLFFLDGRTLNPLQTEGDKAILEGTTVKLKEEAATLLNDTFGVDALEAGLEVGVAEITIDTQA